MQVRTYNQTVELATYLTPSPRRNYGEGTLEHLERQAGDTADLVGRLLAFLVERRSISFEEATDIAGSYGGTLVN